MALRDGLAAVDEQIAVRQGGVRGERQLAAVAAAGPWPADLDEATGQTDEAALRAVAISSALGLVPALGPTSRVSSSAKRLLHGLRAQGDGEREEVLLGRARELGEGERDLLRQLGVGEVLLCDDARTRYGWHNGPPSIFSPISSTSWRWGGGPPSNSTDYQTTSGDVAETIPAYVRTNPGMRIALLHLDVDLYNPTKVALDMYPLVVAGGVVVLDEYGMTDFPGESAAFDEYFGAERPKLRKCPYSPHTGRILHQGWLRPMRFQAVGTSAVHLGASPWVREDRGAFSCSGPLNY